jgi:hypothetical protein
MAMWEKLRVGGLEGSFSPPADLKMNGLVAPIPR